MTINKFVGKTEEEAIKKAKTELGEKAVIMNVKEVKPKGLFRAFKSSTYEVTAALEDEKEAAVSSVQTTPVIQQTKDSSIDLTADEKIEIPNPQNMDFLQAVRREQGKMQSKENEVEKQKSEEKKLEERLEALSDRLAESFEQTAREEKTKEPSSEELSFIRILYSTLLKNEVDERYVNQVLGEIEKIIRPGNNVDLILSNVYQKLILRFGQPKTIEFSGAKPNVIFFMGSTGVGKTTTIAKIASKCKVDHGKKVAFITADTYRIAAPEQLQVYAKILDAPMTIVYSKDEINDAIAKYADYDLIFVDTAGFSYKNKTQKDNMKSLLEEVDKEYRKEIYLVLSATTKYNDLIEIIDAYKEIADYKLIFTKLDETSTYGNLLNIKLYSGADLSYVTNGQNVPDDIEVFDTQTIVKKLLGGNS